MKLPRNDGKWELTLLDPLVPVTSLNALNAGDVDGDGEIEIITAGRTGLFWYRPATHEKGKIAEGHFLVALTLEDIDGDGILEVVVTENQTEDYGRNWQLVWYKPSGSLNSTWERYVVDPFCNGGAHDIIFADIDSDGEKELIALASYCEIPGIFAYKCFGDIREYWTKHTVMSGIFAEGLAAGDLDNDGRVEIVCGPDIYICPKKGAFSGIWERRIFAPSFREMCRTALIDITGNGRADIIITDSEYEDGRLSWFENRMVEDRENQWIEHVIEQGVVFSHSLSVWEGSEPEGSIHVFLAEMAAGGWNAPYNADARLLEFITSDSGATWKRELIYRGEGTHQAMAVDIDGDGDLEIVGKNWGEHWENPKMQIWKKQKKPSPITCFQHQFIDRDKPMTGIDILTADIDDDGLEDVICASWWYKNPGWERFSLPEGYHAVYAYDIDRDGCKEIIAFKMLPKSSENTQYVDMRFTSEMYWLKPIEPLHNKWEVYPIGKGMGDWPHGVVAAPVLPGGKEALILGYHSANNGNLHYPEIFEIPDDPKAGLWNKRILMEIVYGEQFAVADIDGDGKLDIVAGPYWLENLGDGCFKPHRIAQEGFKVARIAVMDVNVDGKPDIIMTEEVLDFDKGITPFSKIAWFENPGDSEVELWKMHVIDTVRCGHSLGVGDLDGDGELEIVCGEHDPFKPYRSRCHLMVYKKSDVMGETWKSYILDERFEHHDGAKVFEIEPGKPAILSHGWKDNIYVHLWVAG